MKTNNYFEVDDQLLAYEAMNPNFIRDNNESIEIYLKKSSFDKAFELIKREIRKDDPNFKSIVERAATEEEIRSYFSEIQDSKSVSDFSQKSNFKEDLEDDTIELYDFEKTFDENFEGETKKKYILMEVRGKNDQSIINPSNLPTPQSKIILNFEEIEKHSSIEFALIDYEALFGTRFTTFIKYNSSFFSCDERVFFEGLLIKFKRFDFKPFYWSKETIFKEIGVKKDRATKIIERFSKLGIISTEIRKSVVDNRPQQITYFNVNSERILELVSQIFISHNENYSAEMHLEKYLAPVLNKSTNILK